MLYHRYRNSRASFLVLVLATISFAQDLDAAEVSVGSTASCAFELTGTIRPGDDEQLSDLGLDRRYEPVTMCLNSTGGDIEAGSALFDAIWWANISTRVRTDHTCTDACAIAFMGGGDVVGTQLTRQIARGIEPGAILVLPALDASLATDHLRETSYDGVPAIPPGILEHLQNGKAFPVDSVGDAVLAGIDILLPTDQPVESDQQLQNICDNTKVAATRNEAASASTNDVYEVITAKGQSRLVAVPYFLGTAGSPQGDLLDLFVVASYRPADDTPNDDIMCIVEFDRAPPASSYGDPAFSAHKASGVRVALFESSTSITRIEELNRDVEDAADEIAFFEVPRWYSLSPDTLIADLARQ